MGRDATPSVGIDRILSVASFSLPYFRAQSAWTDHGPFALWLMETLRPRTFVELGTHGGYSYFAFCQAVKADGIGTKCYAVDTWAGDEHAGFYGEEFYNRVFDYNEAHYADFSRLVRSTFDEALQHFTDGSIDLLHIDGRHFYDDVTHDFESWRPKLSDRAVVIFHDINVRERDFGVFRLWERLRGAHPSFEFHHGHGLGVLGYGPNIPPAMAQWLADVQNPRTADFVRTAYSRLGGTLKAEMVANDRLSDLHVHAKNLAADRDRINATVGELMAQVRAEAAKHHAETVRAETLASQLNDAIAAREMADQRRARYQEDLHYMTLDRNAKVEAMTAAMAAMTSSTSWRITQPLRLARTLPGTILRKLHAWARPIGRKIYHAAPLPLFVKRWIVVLYFGAEETAVDEVVLPIEADYSAEVPFGYSKLPAAAPRIAAICHVFHEQTAVEFQRYLDNIPTAFDVFISTDTDAKKATIVASFEGWTRGKVEVRVTPNRGRDIAPKLIGFHDVYGNYDYVLHLHSKISKHAGVLENWRGFILQNLMGSRAIVESVLTALAQRPDLGMIGAQHFEPVRHWLNWGNNFIATNALANRMGFSISSRSLLDFPSGSMFWARAAALKPLLDLNLRFEDFPDEKGQLDGTLAHAIERIYFYVCEKAGFGWIKIASPAQFGTEAPIVPIAVAGDLDRFIAEHGAKLTGPNPPPPRKKQPKQIMPAPTLVVPLQDIALGCDLTVDTSKRVSVGIVTYNNPPDELARAVRSAHRALARAGLESRDRVLVLDNGAPSAVGDVVRLPAVGNVGFGAGHNRLMTEAFARGADVYIATNPDGAFHPDAITALMQMMQAHRFRALIDALQFPMEHPKVYDLNSFETPWTSGACLMIPRALFEASGGFDETFFMYCEDVDFAWRARGHGFALRTCPRALFLHAVTNRSSNPKTQAMIYTSHLLLARKWGSAAYEKRIDGDMRHLGMDVPETVPATAPTEWRRYADFDHPFTFAKARW